MGVPAVPRVRDGAHRRPALRAGGQRRAAAPRAGGDRVRGGPAGARIRLQPPGIDQGDRRRSGRWRCWWRSSRWSSPSVSAGCGGWCPSRWRSPRPSRCSGWRSRRGSGRCSWPTLAALLWLRGRPGPAHDGDRGRRGGRRCGRAGVSGAAALEDVRVRDQGRGHRPIASSATSSARFTACRRSASGRAATTASAPSPAATHDATYVLIGIVVAACVLGVAWCVRRRAWLPLLFLGVSLIGWGYATRGARPGSTPRR